MSHDRKATETGTRAFKIITIDDEAPVRLLIRQCLRRENCDVFEASNGREGLDVIRDVVPDLILMDVTMPEMSGIEALRVIRTDASLAHIPVLLLTGFKDNEQLHQALQLPYTDLLPKPFQVSDLRARVEKMLHD
ncbi:MAG: response regulator [bacterium]